jgi:hypothetical protein
LQHRGKDKKKKLANMAAEDSSVPIKTIKLVRIAHVYYKHNKDVAKVREFMSDFGFLEVSQVGKKIYYRGYGTEPFVICLEESDETAFGGAAFVVESEEDLIHASKILPAETKPSEVYELTDAPGGGKCVTFYDPVDGFPFHLVHGQTPVEATDPCFPVLKVNYVSIPKSLLIESCITNTDMYTYKPMEKNRGPNTFQRFQKRPAPIHKLGHFGMCVTNFKKCYEFYSKYFNFFPSEVSKLCQMAGNID